MKPFQFFYKKEAGVALITVVLMTALVVGLIILALTNGMVGQTLTITHFRHKQHLRCAEGDLAVAQQIFLGAGSGLAVAGIKVDPAVLDQDMGKVAGNPDITITNPNTPDCTTSVNVDYLYKLEAGGDAGGGNFEGTAEQYHGYSLRGAACDSGDVYDITAVTTQAGAISTVRSVYYKCP